MRVYVSADMEGVTGLVGAEDVQMGGRDYERGRAMMTEDVNAAVSGALQGGAAEVLVNDTHSTMRNLLVDQLHPRVALVRGKPKPMGMVQDLDADFDAMVCVGYHSRAGTLGVLSHNFMGHEIEDMWLDERPMGEIGFAHATATALGVPVVALFGDDAACEEMRAWDDTVLTAPVKYARDRFAARLRPAAEAREAITQTTADAVRRTEARTAQRPAPDTTPHTLAVRWQSASVAQQLAGIPGVTRHDDRTVTTNAPLPALFRLFGVFMSVAYALTGQAPYC
ncbi:M55 family metallopeptidase [Streptomyces iconiensis]|uniref:M55 family metallopeptidase n=1 Tax=Streptomyces iconiensis TaxID=1384038 RepID=A0ABT7A437_9ACTN|nr:M55 family metallopeptidase [Streptomyces iconiensis]MDJ1136100.1 M55 family metallopeptidase [Streptomyces iconiensis]